MAAGDFSMMPTWVHEEEPQFNIVVTQTENLKKDRQSISTNAVYKYRLVFTGISDADYKTIRDHFVAQRGSYTPFSWINAYIPAWFKTLRGITSANLTVRWVDGSFKSTIRPKSWDVEVMMEEEIS